MKEIILNILRKIFCHKWLDNDPVYKCKVYIDEGCAHVDGMLCDMNDCSTLEEFEKRVSEPKEGR